MRSNNGRVTAGHRLRVTNTAGLVVVSACLAFGADGAAAQDRLGSVDAYLMDRSVEISLARSAAPYSIGEGATVMVLTRRGYEVAARGMNGFTCFVGRGWSGQLQTTQDGETTVAPDVFDPGLVAPHCLNEAATRTVWPLHEMRTRLLLEGRTVAEVVAGTATALQKGDLSVPSDGAFAYMMSSGQRLGAAGVFRPHVMLYQPRTTNEGWGVPGPSREYPFVADGGAAWAIVVIPTPLFSDGTAAVRAGGD